MAQNGPDGEHRWRATGPGGGVWQARTLLRGADPATLATAEDGQPYAALVTPAAAPDLSLLVLLSGLSAHTRHLRADGRCALMVQGEATDANPQTAPRLTVTGRRRARAGPGAEGPLGRPPPLRRVLRRSAGLPPGAHPAHRRPVHRRLRQRAPADAADLTPDPAAVAAVADAEASLLAHVTADHARRRRIAGSAGWRMAAVDVDGCDLVREEAVRRIAWSGTGGGCGGGAGGSWRGCQASRALPCTRKGTVVPFTPFEGGWRTTVARMVG